MSLCQTYILLLLLSLFSCQALRCTTNCLYIYNSSTPFLYPERCNQIVSSGKCGAMLTFYFHTGEYFFSLSSDSSSTVYNSNNQRRGLLQISESTASLSHYVDIECKDKDDCAKDLAIKISIELSQRQYDFSKIINELSPYIIGPSLSTQNRPLKCYNSKEKEELCASCFLQNQIIKNKITQSCQTTSSELQPSIRMHQNPTTATFDLTCTRNLCNTKSILNIVKDILFKYNVTQTPDGRLNGSRFQISVFLMIITIIFAFFHRF
ncbi:hypothetical protein I4U23_022188 [Adineta vaga]|nr:hypothetical protein I4U23_022188 [Adineta vaga]